MPFRLKISLAILAVIIFAIVVAPLLFSPSEPPGVRPLAEVAGPDAEYLSVEGVDLHVVRSGGADDAAAASESEKLFLLLHGFPYSTASFAKLAPLLDDLGEVVAVDLPGFGLSERPLGDELSAGFNPYSAAGQVTLISGLLTQLRERNPSADVILVGSDSGARLALDVALALQQGDASQEPAGLVLIGASPFTSSTRSWLSRTVMNSPQLKRLGPVFLRQIAQEPGLRILRAGRSEPAAITQDELDAYQRPWTVEGWDDALWELTKADAPPSLEGSLGVLNMPALVVAGAEDGVVPITVADQLANELPDASVALVASCGHAVQAECPTQLAQLIGDWLGAAVDSLP